MTKKTDNFDTVLAAVNAVYGSVDKPVRHCRILRAICVDTPISENVQYSISVSVNLEGMLFLGASPVDPKDRVKGKVFSRSPIDLDDLLPKVAELIAAEQESAKARALLPQDNYKQILAMINKEFHKELTEGVLKCNWKTELEPCAFIHDDFFGRCVSYCIKMPVKGTTDLHEHNVTVSACMDHSLVLLGHCPKYSGEWFAQVETKFDSVANRIRELVAAERAGALTGIKKNT